MKYKYLVTPALPYANGPIHLGHMLEHVQVNIFVRALRMAKRDVLYICGADSHGTPIEMNALKAAQSPEEFAKNWQYAFENTFKDYDIEFDNGFGTTHSVENEAHATQIFNILNDKGLIKKKTVEQLFDPELKRFLPDRMVLGTCPKCQATEQYGDNCEACGSTYQPTDLLNPKSALSGAIPVLQKSEHYFVSLGNFTESLKEWTKTPGTIHDDTLAFLKGWFADGLRDWDISRDGPYFGFKIPGEENKYFYVWLDAPIGYISLSESAAKKIGRSCADYWQDKNTKIIHFIGKDIVYFHTLFWPAMLMAAGYTLPSKIVVHGMLTINGEKMSKSRGTFILADTFKKHINPEALRYYYACKLSKKADDIDLNFSDLAQRVNSDLVNKIVNLISRSLPMLHRFYEGQTRAFDNTELLAKAHELCERISLHYEDNEPGKALNEIVRFAEEGNKFLQDSAPWALVKSDPEKAHKILTEGLYVGKVALALLKPVIPSVITKLEAMLNDGQDYTFANISEPISPTLVLQSYDNLFERIDENGFKAITEESLAKKPPSEKDLEPKVKLSPNIDFQKFMDVDLRAAKVIAATAVEGSDKLIACTLDVGELGQRQVFSGLRPFVEPEQILGQTVVLVANLEPRKMRFGLSEGMILACGEEKPTPLILNGVKPGERVR